MPDRSLQQPIADRPLDAAVSGGGAASWPVLETAHGSLLAVGVAAMGLAPRALPVLVSLLALVTLAEVVRSGKSIGQALREAFSPLPMRAAVALFGFAVLSTLWAADRRLAFVSAMQVGSLILASGAMAALLPAHLASLPAVRRERFLRATVFGFLAALLFLAVEFAAGNALSFAILRAFPSLASDSAKGIVREGGHIVHFHSFFLDRNVAAMTLLLPAGLMAVAAWLPRAAAAWVTAGLALVAGAIVAASSSSAAGLAAACAAVVAVLAWRWPIAVNRGLMAIVTLGVVLAVPLGHIPSKLGMESAPWAPPSARERAMIWDRTATAVLRQPIHGIGVQSTRFMEPERKVEVDGLAGARRQLGWHAHNFVLQTWLELGAIGAFLLLAFALATLRSIEHMQTSRQPAALALFAMVAAIGVTGWGLWQPWLIAVFGMAVACLVAVEPSRRSASG